MFCPYCGKSASEDAVFCPGCGANLLEEAAAVSGSTNHAAFPDDGYMSSPANGVAFDVNPYADESTIPTSTEPASDANSFASYASSYSPAPQSNQQVATALARSKAADMPNKTVCIVLIVLVLGFLSGVIWGAIGVSQYGGLKRAIDQGDVETARKKARIIYIAFGIGIAVNVLYLIVIFAMAVSR